jgi:hypothetical protein
VSSRPVSRAGGRAYRQPHPAYELLAHRYGAPITTGSSVIDIAYASECDAALPHCTLMTARMPGRAIRAGPRRTPASDLTYEWGTGARRRPVRTGVIVKICGSAAGEG